MSDKPNRPVDGQVGRDDEACDCGQARIDINTPKRRIKRNTKLGRILGALANGENINRFEAVKNYHDWVLPSTISEIQRFSIRVDRRIETIRGYLGAKTHCARYWLDTEQREKARKLLGL